MNVLNISKDGVLCRSYKMKDIYAINIVRSSCALSSTEMKERDLKYSDFVVVIVDSNFDKNVYSPGCVLCLNK